MAHNVHAAQALATQLALSAKGSHAVGGRGSRQSKTWALVAMLSDKDVAGVMQQLSEQVDVWCVAGLPDIARGLSSEALIEQLATFFNIQNQCTITQQANTVSDACKQLLWQLDVNDRLIIFGSFYTVSEAMQYFSMQEQ